MTPQPPQNWRTLFLGRKEELEWLQSAWDLTVQGRPQIRVLTAESGYGKTKVAQAFYTWLSKEQDPGGYWPDNLLHEEKNLRVMPDMSGVQPGKPIPWFWWGLRWWNPSERNNPEFSNPFLASYDEPAFRWHQEALLSAVHAKEATWKAIFSAGKAGLALFPGTSAAAEIASAWSDVREAFGIWREHADHGERAAAIAKSEEDSIEKVLTTFALLLDPQKGNKGSLPVVLLLDDAQWMDSLSLRIVRELWQAASKGNWPLLILATHWQREWNMAFHGENEATFAGWVFSLRGDGCDSPDIRQLGRLPENSEILKCAFPGLTDEQVQHFVDVASGNPRHIAEIILSLGSLPEWFENEDFSCALIHKWKENAAKEHFDLVSLEQKRFRSIEGALKKLLGTASLQGDRFLRAFTLDVSDKLGFETWKTNDPLQTAENPHALAETLDAATMEFRSLTIRQAAFDYLRVLKPHDEELATAIAACTREWIASGRLARLPLHQQLPLLDVSFRNADEAGDRAAQTLFAATALQLIQESGIYLAAPRWLERWKILSPKSEDFPGIDLWKLLDVAECIAETGDVMGAFDLCGILEKQVPATADLSRVADLLRLARFFLEFGDLQIVCFEEEEANKRFSRALEYSLAAIGQCENRTDMLGELSSALHYTARAEEELFNREQALAHYTRAAAIDETLLSVSGETHSALSNLATAYRCIGDLSSESEDSGQALTFSKKALDLRRRILALEGETPGVLAGLCSELNRTAEALMENGNRDGATRHYEEACQYGRKLLLLYGENHSTLSFLISSFSGLADLAHLSGDTEKSKKLQEEASELISKLPCLGEED